MQKKQPDYSLYALGLIFFFSLLQAVRWSTLPQFIDDFYHLLVAQNFVKAGGWVGWDFFEYAPFGRPHLYPPLYHVILSFFLKSGIDGVLLIKIVEVIIVPLFLIALWRVSKELFSPLFSFFAVLLCGSYFHFFVALTSNIPATLGLIWGLLFYLGLYRRDFLLAFLSLLLCSYTHTGMFLSFFLSAVFFAAFDRKYRGFLAKVLAMVLLGYGPLLFHQLRFLKFVRTDILAENRFTHVNIAVLALGLWGIVISLKKKGAHYLIVGFIMGSLIVFFKYFYRYFSAQGFLGWALASAVWAEYFLKRYTHRTVFFALALFFLVMCPTATMDNFQWSFRPADSTFSNFAQGRVFSTVPFNTVFSRRYYEPVKKVIQESSHEGEAVASNLTAASVILASLSNRFTADALFFEVKPAIRFDTFAVSRIIVWTKAVSDDVKEARQQQAIIDKYHLQKLFENEICSVYRNPYTDVTISVKKSSFPLWAAYGIIGVVLGGILWRMFVSLKRANTLVSAYQRECF